MKFQTAISLILLQLMNISGTEGSITIEQASASDLINKIASQLLDNLVSGSITLKGDDNCAAIFTNGKDAVIPNSTFLPTPYDLSSWFPDEGIVISTGNPDNLSNNTSGSQTTCFDDRGADADSPTPSNARGPHPSGDPYLEGVVGQQTFDGCTLEFQFNAPEDATELYFEYLFGSDEYVEFVGRFNDAFALLLNGENIAIVPDTRDTIVSINTVNADTNSDRFILNDPGTSTEYDDPVPYPNFAPDGFTTLLIAKGDVNPGELNTLSFHIADTKDCIFDSWVLIRAGSLSFDKITSAPTTLHPTATATAAPTVSQTVAPTDKNVPAVTGDPHFKTWTGESYDFHGVCDLVLIHSAAFGKGMGMDVHIRTERMDMWSYVASAVIRIGQEMFEVMGGTGVKIWTNGVEGTFNIDGEKDEGRLVSSISGYPIRMTRESEKQNEFVIELDGDEQIVISTWHLFVRVLFKNSTEENFKGSVGLMGSFPDGMKLARDSSTIIENFNTFGQEWQVFDSESKLFHRIKQPQHPSKCEIPSSSEMRRRLGKSKMTIDEAEKACAKVNEAEMDLCIFDVMATNNELTAGAY